MDIWFMFNSCLTLCFTLLFSILNTSNSIGMFLIVKFDKKCSKKIQRPVYICLICYKIDLCLGFLQ